MTEIAGLSCDDLDPGKTELGLLPRLIAAGWFAAAALIPIAGFILMFARRDVSDGVSESNSGGPWFFSGGLWFLSEFPISLAAFYGFAVGSRILDLERPRSAFRAMLRGIAVAVLSYLSLPVSNLVFGMLSAPGENMQRPSLSVLLYFTLVIYAVGAVLVGWLIVIAGAVAGLLLDWMGHNEKLRKVLSAAPRVTRRRAYELIGVAAIILTTANAVFLLFPALLQLSQRWFFQILDRLD